MTITIHHIAHQNSQLLPPSPEPPRVLGVGFNLQYSYLHMLSRVQKVTPVSLQTQHREASWTAPTFASVLKDTVPGSQATRKHETTDLLNYLGKSCPQGPRPRSHAYDDLTG